MSWGKEGKGKIDDSFEVDLGGFLDEIFRGAPFLRVETSFKYSPKYI